MSGSRVFEDRYFVQQDAGVPLVLWVRGERSCCWYHAGMRVDRPLADRRVRRMARWSVSASGDLPPGWQEVCRAVFFDVVGGAAHVLPDAFTDRVLAGVEASSGPGLVVHSRSGSVVLAGPTGPDL